MQTDDDDDDDDDDDVGKDDYDGDDGLGTRLENVNLHLALDLQELSYSVY